MSVTEPGPDLMLPGPSPLRAPSKTPSSLDTFANKNTEAQKAEWQRRGTPGKDSSGQRKFRPSREEPQSGKPPVSWSLLQPPLPA